MLIRPLPPLLSLILILMLSVSACSSAPSEPVLDASSEKAFNESTDRILETLDEDKGTEFLYSIAEVLLLSMSSGGDPGGGAQVLDGLNADEVIALAQKAAKDPSIIRPAQQIPAQPAQGSGGWTQQTN